jgi:uncharacterized protein YdaU (DUF1376 family)
VPSEKSPAFLFYPRDFLADSHVAVMDLTQRGAYVVLLCYAWLDGSIPADSAHLAKLVGVTVRQFDRLWPAVAVCFQPHPSEPGRLVQGRLERERVKKAGYESGATIGGRARVQTAKRDGGGRFQPAIQLVDQPKRQLDSS